MVLGQVGRVDRDTPGTQTTGSPAFDFHSHPEDSGTAHRASGIAGHRYGCRR